MSDRAEDIAREIANIYVDEAAENLSADIAAALRAYADEKLEEAAMTVMLASTGGKWHGIAEFIRSLKSTSKEHSPT